MCGSIKRKVGSMNLQIFSNEEFGEVRVEEINGDPWFVAADVCRALDLGNSRQAITRLDEDEKGVTLNDTLGGKQEMTIINEAGHYTLVLSSRKPKADYFDDLVNRNLLSSFTDTAKELGIKRKDFIGFLLDQGYIYRDKKGNLVPRANEKEKDLFEVKQCSNQKTAWAGCQTLLTPKGVETFRLLCQGM